MRKNRRKIRVGSRAWAEQKERDIARAKQEGNGRRQEKKKEWKQQEWKWQEEKKEKKETHEPQEPISATRKMYLKLLGLTRHQDNVILIKAAFRGLALQFHPDKNTSPDAESKMKTLNEAYAFLCEN